VLVTFPSLGMKVSLSGTVHQVWQSVMQFRSDNSANDEFTESATAGHRSTLIRMTSFACDRRGFTLAAAWGKRVTNETPNGLYDSEFLVNDPVIYSFKNGQVAEICSFYWRAPSN